MTLGRRVLDGSSSADSNGSNYVAALNHFPHAFTYALTTVKLILLHDTKNDDGIRLFFGDVWELYVKVR